MSRQPSAVVRAGLRSYLAPGCAFGGALSTWRGVGFVVNNILRLFIHTFWDWWLWGGFFHRIGGLFSKGDITVYHSSFGLYTIVMHGSF